MKSPEEYLKEYGFKCYKGVFSVKEVLEIIKKIQFDTANTVLESLGDKIKNNESVSCNCLSYIYDMQESIDLVLNGEEGRLY